MECIFLNSYDLLSRVCCKVDDLNARYNFLVWFDGYNVPVNNFSVMLGRSHRFLGITSTFLGVNMPCSRTQHGDPSGARTPDFWIGSPRC